MQIRVGWNNVNNCITHEFYFFHEYVKGGMDKPIHRGTMEECKKFAQQYFEKYITQSYFEQE